MRHRPAGPREVQPLVLRHVGRVEVPVKVLGVVRPAQPDALQRDAPLDKAATVNGKRRVDGSVNPLQALTVHLPPHAWKFGEATVSAKHGRLEGVVVRQVIRAQHAPHHIHVPPVTQERHKGPQVRWRGTLKHNVTVRHGVECGKGIPPSRLLSKPRRHRFAHGHVQIPEVAQGLAEVHAHVVPQILEVLHQRPVRGPVVNDDRHGRRAERPHGRQARFKTPQSVEGNDEYGDGRE